MMLTTGPETATVSHAVPREIPFNYTSADDRQAIASLLGRDIVRTLDELREHRVTGRSARLLMSSIGEILIHRRNPYLFQELVDSPQRRQRLFERAAKDLDIIANSANGETRVITVVAAVREQLDRFRTAVENTPELRRRLRRELGAVVGVKNVLFDPFSLAAHATDATDWRLHLPVAVVTPAEEHQVAPLITAIANLGLKIIPRGAGTGLTGGAVPLRSRCVIINMEKLNRSRGISLRDFHLDDGSVRQAPVIEIEAGVVTERAMLDDISVRSKAWLLKTASDMSSSDHFRDMLRDPHFHLFYGAPALVVISTPVSAQWSVEDCSLAAQNLMLAAVDLDLGSCWIGFAQGWLNTPEGRECLGLSASSCVVAPITIGYPRSEAPLVSRKAPIVTWIGVLPSAESGPPGSSNSPPSHP